MPKEEFPNSQPDLNCIHSWIGCRQSCIRDVHVTEFQAQVSLRAEDVHSQRRLIHEVHCIRSGWDIVTREQDSTSQL